MNTLRQVKVGGMPEKTEPYLLQFLGKIKADPAITLTGIGLQQTPTGCSLTVCFLYNCKYTLSSVLLK